MVIHKSTHLRKNSFQIINEWINEEQWAAFIDYAVILQCDSAERIMGREVISRGHRWAAFLDKHLYKARFVRDKIRAFIALLRTWLNENRP